MAANISVETASILNDSRGEDVRDSFVSALEKIATVSLPDVSVSDAGNILAVSDSGSWSALSITPTLSNIVVTTQPTKTSYVQGETLDFTGIVVTATYTADLAETITQDVTDSCSFSPDDGDVIDLSGDQVVTVTYTEDGKEVFTSFEITVEHYLSSIEVTSQPTKTAYQQGQILDLSGTVISAVYSDGEKEDVTEQCTFNPADGTMLDTIGSQNVSVSYDTKTASIPIVVSEIPVLESITVTSQPTKTRYQSGEYLDLSGIVVKATYSDDSTVDVTNRCSFAPINGTKLTTDQVNELVGVTINYIDGDVSKFTSITVTVTKVGIEVTATPVKMLYNETNGYDFQSAGIAVTFTDINGTTSDVTSQCTIDPPDGTIFSVPDEGSGTFLEVIVVEYVNSSVHYYAEFFVIIEY